MESQSSRLPFSPSLMWVLPIACSIWIGLIVEGWLAHVVVRNRVLAAGDSVLEAMVAPGFLVLLGWLVFTPASWVHRARVLGFLVCSSVPIAYLSFQQPGLELTTLWPPVRHYTNRVYFVYFLNLTWHDFIIAASCTLAILMAFNRWMTRIVFQRIPVATKSGAKPSRSDLYYAFWGPTPFEDTDFESSHLRNERIVWSFIGVVLLIGCVWYVATGSLLKFHSLFLTGLAAAMTTYLWIWIASHFYRPWWTLLFLAFGASAVSVLAQFIEFVTAFGPRSRASELGICGTAAIVSALLVSTSLILLARTQQMPRRCRKRVSGWTPADYYGSSERQSFSVARFWMVGLTMFVSVCGLAYWVPTRIDAVAMIDANGIAIRDGWLAAKVLRNSQGNRQVFDLRRVGKKTLFSLRLPRLADEWKEYGQMMKHRVKEGDICRIHVEDPVTDLKFLQELLDQGIEVTCSIDAKGTKLPTTLFNRTCLKITGLFNAVIDSEEWNRLAASHPRLPKFVQCQVLAPIPEMFVQLEPKLISCSISPEIFLDLGRKISPSRFELNETQFSGPLDGHAFFRFIYAGRVFSDRPPMQSPVVAGFPRIFAPVYYSEHYSKWQVSTRFMLTEAEVLADVTRRPWSVPSHFVMDSMGRLTRLGVKPTRDCPKNVPWVTMPDVEHLVVDLSISDFDSRPNGNVALKKEEITFQSNAFPNLSSVSLHTGVFNNNRFIDQEPWDPRLDGFLRELFSDPKVIEIEIDAATNYHPNVWRLLQEHGKVERLVLRDFSVFRQSHNHVSKIPVLNSVRQVIVVDGAVFRAFEVDETDLTPEEILLAKENAKTELINRKRDAEEEWTERFRRFAPNATVEIVPPEESIFKFGIP